MTLPTDPIARSGWGGVSRAQAAETPPHSAGLCPLLRPVRLGVDGRVLDDRYHGIGRITYELLDRLTASPDTDVTIFLNDRAGLRPLRHRGVDVPPRRARRHFRTRPHLGHPVLRWPSALAPVRGRRRPVPLSPRCGVGRRSPADLRRARLHSGDGQTFRPRRGHPRVVPDADRGRRSADDGADAQPASSAAVREHYGVAVPDSRVVEWGVRAAAATGSARRRWRPAVARPLLPARRRPPAAQERAPAIRVLALLPPAEHLVLVGTSDDRWRIRPRPSPASWASATASSNSRRSANRSWPRCTGRPGVSSTRRWSRISGCRCWRRWRPARRWSPVTSRSSARWPSRRCCSSTRRHRRMGAGHPRTRRRHSPRDALIADGRRLAASRTWQRAADRLASILAAP